MFSYNFKFAFRNLTRNKIFALINILGLSVGIACVMIIYLWVQDELSYDRFHADTDNIYRVVQTQYYTGGEEFNVDVTQLGMAKFVKEKIPGVVYSSSYTNHAGKFLIQVDDKNYIERIHLVDPDFLEIFSFDIIKGDKDKVLNDPHSLMLTEEMAKKIFGEENPIGRIVNINNKYAFTIAGIIKNPPNNSHIRFKILAPKVFFKDLGRDLDDMGNNFLFSYVQFNNDVNIKEAGEMLTKLICEDEDASDEICTKYYFQPLKRIHLYPVWGNGPIRNVKIFSLIAVLILIIACINFVNLSTALATGRFKEIGLKKMVGAQKIRLVAQYYFEVIILLLIAFFLALIVVESVLPAFNELTRKEITLSLFNNIKLLAGLVVVFIITVALSGTYPALFISRPTAAKVIKGDIYFGKKKSLFREILVILQFTIALVLIINSIIITKQLVFMQNRELGLNKENIVCIPFRGDLRKNYQVFKNELLQNKNILGVTFSTHKPTATYSNSGGWKWPGKPEDVDPLVTNSSIDFDYAATLGLKMHAGEFFPRKSYDDTSSVVINKTFADLIGIDPLVGEMIKVWDYDLKVVGIVEDYNFKPAFAKIEPIGLFIRPGWYSYAFIKVSANELTNTMKYIEDLHTKLNPAYPFDYNFLDEDFDNLYRGEKQRKKIFSYFSFISIFISCLGLFGLSLFIINQSIKEIGIRKANGASILSIILLFLKGFSKWIGIAIIISFPVAFYTMHKWLENYAYRTSISWWVFIAAGLIAYVIAILTVGWQSWRAASRNPVEALRYE